MSISGAIRIDPARWLSLLNAVNAATSAPTSDTNGVAVPKSRRNETAWIAATKHNVADLEVYGQATATSSANVWLRVANVSFAGLMDEAISIPGLSAFKRIMVTRTDANATSDGCNAYVGFSVA